LVEYQKEGSTSAAEGMITGQANLNEENKIEAMNINYFELIDQLSKVLTKKGDFTKIDTF